MLSPVVFSVLINNQGNRTEYALGKFAVITNQEGVEQVMRNDRVAGKVTLLSDCDMHQHEPHKDQDRPLGLAKP